MYKTIVRKSFSLYNGIGELHVSEGTELTAQKIDEGRVGLTTNDGLVLVLNRAFARKHLSKPQPIAV